MNLPLENLSKKQLIVIASVIAVIGVGVGLLSGNVLKTVSLVKPANPGQNTLQIPVYSGRIFPAIDETSPIRYSHKLVNSSGETSAYLSAADDKLKVVLPTTNVTVEGAVVGKQDNLPIVRVERIKF